jgi:hypothetical protein
MLYRVSRPPQIGSERHSVSRRSVGISEFVNTAGPSSAIWPASFFSEGLTREVGADGEVVVLRGDAVDPVFRPLPRRPLTSIERNALTRLRDELGVDFVLSGSYRVTAGTERGLRIDARLQSTATGECSSIHEWGPEAKIEELLARVGARVRLVVGVGADASSQSAESAEVERYCSEAEQSLREWDGVAARDLLERALGLNPRHGPAYAALSVSWRLSGWDDKARQAARSAIELSAPLGRPQRLLAHARYAEASRDWASARESYEQLIILAAGNIDYDFGLIEAQQHSRDTKGVSNRIGALTSPAVRDEPRYWVLRAAAAGDDVENMHACAAKGRALAEQKQLPFVAAEAALLDAYALRLLGDIPQSERALASAERVYRSSHEEINLLCAPLRAGKGRRVSSDVEARLAQAGTDRGQAIVAYRRAEAHHLGSRLALARQALDRADEMLERFGSFEREFIPIPPRRLSPISLRAWLEYDTGNIRAARSLLDEYSATAGPDSVPLTDILPYAIVLCEQGEVRRAREVAESGMRRARTSHDQLHLTFVTFALGRVAHAEGRLDDAIRLYRDCVRLSERLGLRTRLWELVVALAERGDVEAAELESRNVERMYQRAKNADRELAGVSARLRILLARGRLNEAQEAGQRARALATGTESARVRLRARIDLAVLDAVQGGILRASSQLGEISTTARRRGLLHTALEAEMAECEVTASCDIQRIKGEAEAAGFGVIMRRIERIESKSH